MSELRFDGRVVAITGAGRGMGRSHALTLARRGASVVVNDVGVDIWGKDPDSGPAGEVATEIRHAGGQAVASTDDVTTREGSRALVASAVAEFGRIDAVVHNAGINYKTPFPEITDHDIDANLDVHYRAAVYLTQEAWPHFLTQGGGNCLFMCSDGVFGNPTFADYSAAKMAQIGLMRTLALEGQPYGIRVNAVNVGAATRMWADTMTPQHQEWGERFFSPEGVSQVVAWLVHPDNPTTGGWYSAQGWYVTRIGLGVGEGYAKIGMAAEDVEDNWDQICRLDQLRFPQSTAESFGLSVQAIVEAGGEPMPTSGFGTGTRRTQQA
jgi:NAD(P)-dependent dehydrogenase (short-subunit alcohol dehydrogenase family)